MMNGWGAMFLLAPVVAVFSIPVVMFALLMRLVGRVGTRTLIVILATDSILWGMSACYWWFIRQG